MKDFRPLNPSCQYSDEDIRKALKILGVEDIATKEDIENIEWDDIKNRPNMTNLLREYLREVDPDKCIGFVNSTNADWLEDDPSNPAYISNKPTKLSLFEKDLKLGNFDNDIGFVTNSEILNSVNTANNTFKSNIESRVGSVETLISENNETVNVLAVLTAPARALSEILNEYGLDILIQNLESLGFVVSADNETIHTPLKITLISEDNYESKQEEYNTIMLKVHNEISLTPDEESKRYIFDRTIYFIEE